MQAIATLIQDDPFLKLSAVDRLALKRARRDRFWKVLAPIPELPIVLHPKPSPILERVGHWFAIVSDKPAPGYAIKIDDVLRVCCSYFELTRDQITSARRTAQVVYARQIAMYLCKYHTTKSYPEIGRRLGGRDHTTVMHGFRRVEARIPQEWLLAYDVAQVEAML